MNKKEEKTLYGDQVVYLTFLNPQEFSRIENPTSSSVHCFPVKDNKILFTVNDRGLDIIGGHIEKGESPEQALSRECMEEGCLVIKKMRFIGAIQVDNRDNPKAKEKGYAPIGYQLFYAIDKFDLKPFEANFECTAREFVPQDNIQERHHKWLGVHRELINELNISYVLDNKRRFKLK